MDKSFRERTDLFLDSNILSATLYDPVSGDSHILMKDNFDLAC